jgi:hypothetical protein
LNEDSLNPGSNKIEAILVFNTKSKMNSNESNTNTHNDCIDSNSEKSSKVIYCEKHYHCDVTPKKQQQQQEQKQPDAPKKLNTTNRASPNFNPKRLKFDS